MPAGATQNRVGTLLGSVHLYETGQVQSARSADLVSQNATLKGRLARRDSVAVREREALVAVGGRLRIENVPVATDLLAVQVGTVYASQIGDVHLGRLDLEESVVSSGCQIGLG